MSQVNRRDALRLLALAGTGAAASTACSTPEPEPKADNSPGVPPGDGSAILGVDPLGFQWKTRDPFLFCVHHDDHYPAGNAEFAAPPAALAGRKLGSDFVARDGYRMYHGRTVPGFPQHPHRGFETVTVVRRGLLDHSDSLGAAARYGQGDVQWLTAGSGISHAEMFPLLNSSSPNPLELFQIWLNLPAKSKMVPAHFSMLWKPQIPSKTVSDSAGRKTRVTVIAGKYGDSQAPAPPPNSWASQPDTGVSIWTLAMAPGAEFSLPAAAAGVNRTLYFFAGQSLSVDGRSVSVKSGVQVRPERQLALVNGPQPGEVLMLQGRPIGEPVARRGPFVMNSPEEIRQAYADYRSTRFGGWPWKEDDPVHGAKPERFARRADGNVERPG